MSKTFPEIKIFSQLIKEERDIVIDFFPKIMVAGYDVEVHIERAAKDGDGKTNDVTAGHTEGRSDFQAWVNLRRKAFLALANRLRGDMKESGKVIVYGVWAGKGVNGEGDFAVGNIPDKTFFMHAVRITTDDEDVIIHSPEIIADYAPKPIPVDMKVLPGLPSLSIDFSDKDSFEDIEKGLANAGKGIHDLDPYIKEEYDIEGKGWRIMFWPGSPLICDFAAVEKYAFDIGSGEGLNQD